MLLDSMTSGSIWTSQIYIWKHKVKYCVFVRFLQGGGVLRTKTNRYRCLEDRFNPACINHLPSGSNGSLTAEIPKGNSSMIELDRSRYKLFPSEASGFISNRLRARRTVDECFGDNALTETRRLRWHLNPAASP